MSAPDTPAVSVGIDDAASSSSHRDWGYRAVLCSPLLYVAFSRWGAYIGLASLGLFVADLLLFFGALSIVLVTLTGDFYSRRIRGAVAVLVATTVMYGLGWLLVAGQGLASASTAVRDVLPFMYLLAAPLYLSAVLRVGADRFLVWLRRACILHAMWAVPAALGVLDPVQILPAAFGGQPLFALRNDFDGVVFGLSIVVAYLHVVRGRYARAVDLLMVVACLTALIAQPSRAGLLSAVLMLAIALLTCPPRSVSYRVVVVSAAAVGLTSLSIILLSTLPDLVPSGGAISRLGLGPDNLAGSVSASGGENTAEAREHAWDAVLEYVGDKDASLLGLGPGAEIVRESGAVAYLSGDPAVRSPHSWPVGLYSRYGYVGAVLWVSSIAAMTLTRSPYSFTGPSLGRRKLLAAAASILVAIVLSSLVGVVIESPFGVSPLVLACACIAACRASREGSGSAVTKAVGASGPTRGDNVGIWHAKRGGC